MFEPSLTPAVAVKAFTAAVDGLLALDLTAVPDDDLLGVLRDVEAQRRRLASVDHALVAELDERSLWHRHGARHTADLLRQVLRIPPGQARARVLAAERLGPRRALTGEPLAPRYPQVADAQAAGDICGQHAAVITRTVEALPAAAAAGHETEVVAQLVDASRRFDPDQVARIAQRISYVLDPDGRLADDADHTRRREATLKPNPDGSGTLTGRLTPDCLVVWQTILDALAKPRPGADGTPDPRTAGHRGHDALLDAGHRLLRTDLPDSGGTPATVIVRIDLADLEARTGVATTAHGGTISVPDALRLAADAAVIPVVLADGGSVLCYGRSRRYATPAQRLALTARDRGCSFPGCDTPAAWTQTHHVTDWARGGTTDLDNLTLLCGHHHRNFQTMGWTCQMTTGVPHWIPPPWIDPHQIPRRNTMNRW